MIREAAKTPWLWGAGAAVVVIAAAAGGLGAYLAGLGRGGAVADPGAEATATSAVSGPLESGAPPEPIAAAAAVAADTPTIAPPSTPTASKLPVNARSVTKAAEPVKGNATTEAPIAAAAPPPAATRDDAAERLQIARAKLANNLTDQALADLRQIVLDYPNSASATDAAFLSGDVLEKAGDEDVGDLAVGHARRVLGVALVDAPEEEGGAAGVDRARPPVCDPPRTSKPADRDIITLFQGPRPGIPGVTDPGQ